jgi:methyl-accepting chemotaxis protein
MNKNLLFEISQLKDLNFQIEYEIIKIDSYIINIKQRMNQIKQFDYIREKEKDIFLTSKNEINQIEDEFKLKLLNMKNQYNILKEKEQNIKKDIQNIKEQINKLNEIFQSGK